MKILKFGSEAEVILYGLCIFRNATQEEALTIVQEWVDGNVEISWSLEINEPMIRLSKKGIENKINLIEKGIKNEKRTLN